MILEHMEKTLSELNEMSKFIASIKDNNAIPTKIRASALQTEITLLNLELSIIEECTKEIKNG